MQSVQVRREFLKALVVGFVPLLENSSVHQAIIARSALRVGEKKLDENHNFLTRFTHIIPVHKNFFKVNREPFVSFSSFWSAELEIVCFLVAHRNAGIHCWAHKILVAGISKGTKTDCRLVNLNPTYVGAVGTAMALLGTAETTLTFYC